MDVESRIVISKYCSVALVRVFFVIRTRLDKCFGLDFYSSKKVFTGKMLVFIE